MRICVLGPLRVEDGDRRIAPGGPRQRAVLLHLCLHPNAPVPSERLLEEIWGDDPLASAPNALQAAVSRLRRLLPDGRLATTPQGYVLHLGDDEVDAAEFEAAVAAARAALGDGRADHAASLLRAALDLWRGPALQDVRFDPFAQADVARLDELHLVGIETFLEAELARGRGAELVPELRRLVSDHPLRESLHGHLMVALYRAGRQAEALDVYQALRATLIGALGVEPSPTLASLMRAVLRQEPWLDAAPPRPDTPALAPATAPTRRPVTTVHVALPPADDAPGDPEVAQLLGRRITGAVEPILARHGGTLLAASPQEVTAVFGAPVLHEDDAQRACRAALEIVGALAPLLPGGIGASAGVVSGEALADPAQPGGVAGAGATQARALAAAAPAGRVAVSVATVELAGASLAVEPAAPQGFLLSAVLPGGRPVPGPVAAPLIGRDGEQRLLDDLLDRVRRDRRTHLVTVVGEAGLGKTRLLQEFCARHEDAATVLVGRCPPYGEGVTFSPLREVVTAACGGRLDREAIVGLCGEAPDAGLVADRLLQAFGAGDPGAADTTEIAWAARHLLAELARRRPTVLLLDDVGWALPAFLDLVESLTDQVTGVPLLVACTARPELLEERPHWPGLQESGRATVVRLGPLEGRDAAVLADHLAGADRLGPRRRGRLVESSGGNPLFLEHLVAADLDRRPSPVLGPQDEAAGLPATVAALLATRLDRLGPAERAVLAAAAVLGRECRREDLRALLAPEVAGYLDAHLRVLSAKALLTTGGRTVAFRHVLVRQAAYRMLPKADRARLHERAAGFGGDRAEEPATVGRHLARAAGYLHELGDDDAADPLARRAVDLLVRAAAQAAAWGDADAAARAYELAAGLLDPDDPRRPGVLTALGGSLFDGGRLEEAHDVLTAAVESADGPRDRARAEIDLLHVELHRDPSAAAERVDAATEDLAAAVVGDDDGLARLALLRAAVHWNRARSVPAEDAWRQAGEHAARIGDRRRVVQSRYWLASAALWGPTTAEVGIERCRAHLAEVGDSPTGRGIVGLHLAGLLAMVDDVEAAQDLLATSTALLADIGSGLPTALTEPIAFVHALTGDVEAAEAVLRQACDDLAAIGERSSLATAAAVLARTIAVQGPDRLDEAERLVGESWAAGGDHDVSALVVGRSVLARVLVARGDPEAAVEHARAAVTLARTTDFTNQTADAVLDLADALAATGDRDGARAAREQAREAYATKGNRPGVRFCAQLLAGHPPL